jgi:hypothetical protein
MTRFITNLKPNQIFVFGSNTDGIHGAGAAKFARGYGAKMGQATGRMGQTYAIVTKDLQSGEFVGWDKVKEQFAEFVSYANKHESLKFLLTPIGTGIAGASLDDLNSMVNEFDLPKNVVRLWTCPTK